MSVAEKESEAVVEAQEESTEPPSPDATRRRLSGPVFAAVCVVVVAALVLALAGWLRYRAGHDDDLAAARARDQALVAAKTEIATLNSLDYRDVDAGLKAWLRSTTGTLHDQLAQTGANDKQLLAQQQKVTTGKVVAAALTDLDPERGTATAVAAVEITVRGTTGEPTLKRNRFTADLVRTSSGWKLSSLSQVAVNVS